MVRQDNVSHPTLMQPTIVITPTQYDKRALTVTDPLAVANSLFNLSYLTSTNTLRVAFCLAADGGLHRIIQILDATSGQTGSLGRFSYSTGITCLSNIAVRGNQKLRRKLVDAGVVPVLIALMEKVVAALESMKVPHSNEQPLLLQNPVNPSMNMANGLLFNDAAAAANQIAETAALESPTASTSLHTQQEHLMQLDEPTGSSTNAQQQTTGAPSAGPLGPTEVFGDSLFAPGDPMATTNFPTQFQQQQMQQMQQRLAPSPVIAMAADDDTMNTSGEMDDDAVADILYRVDDILSSIKIVAYLSKYPDIRTDLHKNYATNIFELVQVFTTTQNLSEIKKWAIICMRNCFKKDTQSGSLRRCGNLQCQNWESAPREYSKCSRCRRVSYCCKACQKAAWPLHRNWCFKYEASTASASSLSQKQGVPQPPNSTASHNVLPTIRTTNLASSTETNIDAASSSAPLE